MMNIFTLRNKTHREADQLDAEIYHLVDKIERMSAAYPPGRECWHLRAAGQYLRRARAQVRGLMHPRDREDTE